LPDSHRITTDAAGTILLHHANGVQGRQPRPVQVLKIAPTGRKSATPCCTPPETHTASTSPLCEGKLP